MPGPCKLRTADSNYFLTTFGRARRDTVGGRRSQYGSQPFASTAYAQWADVHGKIAQGGVVKRMLDEGQTPEQIIQAIYIRALSREPTDGELQALSGIVEQAENPRAGLQDVFWAVLNSREFVFNH